MKSLTILTLTIILLCGQTFAKPLTKIQVLDGIDARIDKYRTSSTTLKFITADGKPLPAGTTVKIAQTNHKFLFGCNIFKLDRCKTPAHNTAYKNQYGDLFNFATLPFYWWNYTRQPGKPNDARTSQILTWCKANNIAAKGHPLAWNFRDPKWLPKDSSIAMDTQLDRIGRCVKQFAGQIDTWDVVNEATRYDRDVTKKQSPILTKAITDTTVEKYLKKTFTAARKENPNAKLIINDYITSDDYADKVIAILNDENGKPLYDIIGIQSHMHHGYWGPEKTWEVCERFTKFKKPLHFTELTITSGAKTDSTWKTTPEGEARQAKQAVEFYRILFSHPAVEAITWWDFSDQGAWQNAPAGLIRNDMTPKPVYTQLKKLIKENWWTTAQIKTTKDSTATFKGYHGQYTITVAAPNKTLTATFTLTRSTPTPITIKLTEAN